MFKAKLINKFIFTLLVLIASLPVSSADTVLTITSGRGEPFVNDKQNGFYDLIVKNMFKRINIKAKTVLLPSERSLINANTGVDDGNIARIKGIEKKYTNLVMIPGKIIDFDFVAFTKNKKYKVKNWESLKLYNVAFINGWKLFEKKVKYHKSLVRTQNFSQLLELLNNGRADIALYDLWSGVWWMKYQARKTNIQYLKPPIASYQLYLYLNKKHIKLVPRLSSALASMKNDGTYQRIYEQTLNVLLK
ncbi:hypothetical protein MNBD_GAMMA23-1838 [hydrothermal vent metagenome]|uniref:Uncharacterized protein n=1 Tax=hydrothermal vent metagenome TaxID=652676 RepID=A0A3B1A4G5_9ZZZZ